MTFFLLVSYSLCHSRLLEACAIALKESRLYIEGTRGHLAWCGNQTRLFLEHTFHSSILFPGFSCSRWSSTSSEIILQTFQKRSSFSGEGYFQNLRTLSNGIDLPRLCSASASFRSRLSSLISSARASSIASSLCRINLSSH